MKEQLFKEGYLVCSMWGDAILEAPTMSAGSKNLNVMIGGRNFATIDRETGIPTTGLYASPVIWHIGTGSAPVVGERTYEYPLWKTCPDNKLIVKFTALREGVVVDAGNSVRFVVGETLRQAHTMEHWEDCDEPVEHKEMTVAEIEEALGYSVKVVK